MVIATLGPASATAVSAAALREAGADAVRLNGSFLDEAGLRGYLAAALAGGFSPSHVVVDLQGGKTRLGELASPIEVRTGQILWLAPLGSAADPLLPRLPVDRAGFLGGLRRGDTVRVDDGRLVLQIEAPHGAGGWAARVCGEGRIESRKGLALHGRESPPGAELLDRDRALLRLALAEGVTDFAVSYASCPLLEAVRREAASHRADRSIRIHGKIEQPNAIQRLPELMPVADSLWLCRGDLGAEVGLEALPRLQAAALEGAIGRVRLLIAGQVLHHMTVSPRPTRSEVCHVADLVWRGVGGFVLSDETATGRYGPEAVHWLRRLVDSAAW